MNKSVNALALDDEVYLKDCKAADELEERYNALNLSEKDKIVINDYIACLSTKSYRLRDLAYLAGVADSIKLFNGLGAIKDLGA